MTTRTNTDTRPRAWIGCLACYNNARLVGEWFDAEAVPQGFSDAQPFNGYCRVVIDPKIAKAREHYAMWLER